jgi:hypothetical protein
MDTIWQSEADVDHEPRDVRAGPALHGPGVGEVPQFNWATWFATASCQMTDQSEPGRDCVMTFEGVRSVPDAVIS